MLEVQIPQNRETLNKQITALTWQLQQDTREKDKQVHQAALNKLIKATKEADISMKDKKEAAHKVQAHEQKVTIEQDTKEKDKQMHKKDLEGILHRLEIKPKSIKLDDFVLKGVTEYNLKANSAEGIAELTLKITIDKSKMFVD